MKQDWEKKATDPNFQQAEANRKRADRSKARDPRKTNTKEINAESHRNKRAEENSAETKEIEAERKRISRGTEYGKKRIGICRNQSDVNTKDLPKSVNEYGLKPLRRCHHCNAKLYHHESDGFCCSNGQIKVDIPEIPDRLYELLTHCIPADVIFV